MILGFLVMEPLASAAADSVCISRGVVNSRVVIISHQATVIFS